MSGFLKDAEDKIIYGLWVFGLIVLGVFIACLLFYAYTTYSTHLTNKRAIDVEAALAAITAENKALQQGLQMK